VSNNCLIGETLAAAQTLTSVHLDTHVAFFAPASAPGIAQNPVLNIAFDTPTNDINNVVGRGAAVSVVENSAAVSLESVGGAVNRCGKDTVSQGFLH
jgi:hypothetical protein